MTSPSRPKPRYDVVVVGAGIIGLSTALFLRERGLSVAVLDKGVPAYEQSSRNWGWMRTVGQDMAELELALQSRPLWRRWAAEGDFGFRPCGLVSLAETEAEWSALQAWFAQARGRGLDTRELDSEAVARALPQ
ncbi:NAD(P)/FAD-dependent oxidoreductase, partial [Nguyenibacter vanlangensis]